MSRTAFIAATKYDIVCVEGGGRGGVWVSMCRCGCVCGCDCVGGCGWDCVGEGVCGWGSLVCSHEV